MKLKSFYLALFFSMVCFTSYGQTSFRLGGLGYASVGMQSLNFQEKNLGTQSDYILHENLNFQFGGGGFLLFDSKFVVMGQGYGSIYGKENLNSTEITSTYGGGGINLGYSIVNKNDVLFFPTIGLGGASYIVEVENKGQTNFDFGSANVLPQETNIFQLPNSYLDFNLNLHKLFDVNKKDDDHGGISLGLSIGYQLGIKKRDWENLSIESKVQDMNKNKAGTFYFKLLIGGGGFK